MKTSPPRFFSLALLLLLCLSARRSGAQDAATIPDSAATPDGRKIRSGSEVGDAGQTDTGTFQGQEQRIEQANLGEDGISEMAAALLPKPEALQGRRGALQANQGTPRGTHQALRGRTIARNPQSCALCSRERNLCRIISGIFTRSPLPYGYSLVTPVPAGVCNLTITEMKPSKNYFALRRSDGTYILNGNWDIQKAGEYEAGGTTFIYTPATEEHGERLSAPGPLREPVDFMLISQSPNQGIEYEYRVPLPEFAGGNPTGLGLSGGGSRPGLDGRSVPAGSVVPSPGQRRPIQSSPGLTPRNPSYGIHTPSQGSAFHFGSNGGGSAGRPGDTFMPLRPVLQPVIGVGASSGFNSSSTSLYPINPHDPLAARPAGTPRRRLPYLGVPQGSSVDVGSRATVRLPGTVPRGHPITPQGTAQTGSLPRPWKPSLSSQDRGRAPTVPGSPFLPGQPYPRGSGGRIIPSGSVSRGFPGYERGEGAVSAESGGRDGLLLPNQTPSSDGRFSVGVRQPLFKATSRHDQTAKTTTTPPAPTHRTRHHHGTQGTQDRRKVPGKSSEFPAFDPDVQLHPQPKAPASPAANTTIYNGGDSRSRGNQDRPHRHRHQQNGARRNGKKRRKDKTRVRMRGGGRFQWAEKGLTPCSKTCGGGNQTAILSCERKRNKKVVADRRCAHLQRPESRFIPCNLTPCPAEWMPGEWGPCSVTCGMGVQTRPMVCKQVVSRTLTMMVPEGSCLSPPSIATSQVCEAGPCSSTSPTWEAGPWSNCSAPCGLGTRSRKVTCSVRGVAVSEDHCSRDARPVREEVCDMGSCATNTWFFSAWSEQCSAPCGEGVQTRRVHCLAGDTQASCPTSGRPEASRSCTGQSGCGGQWFVGAWNGCSEACGAGQEESRPVLCVIQAQGRWKVVDEERCQREDRPQDTRVCDVEPCKPVWFTSEWSQCSASCGSGIMRREVTCLDPQRHASPDCTNDTKPASRRPCHLHPCPNAASRPAPTPDAASHTERPAVSPSSSSSERENEESEGVDEELRDQSRGTSESDEEETATEREQIDEEEEEEQMEDRKDPLTERTVKEEEATKEEKEEEENELVVEGRAGNDLTNLPGREAQGDESVIGEDEDEEEEDHIWREDKGVDEDEEEEEEEGNDKRRKRKRKKERKKNKDRRITDPRMSLGSERRGSESIERPVCIDRIKNCHLVFRARLCRLKYYNKLCCRTCTATN